MREMMVCPPGWTDIRSRMVDVGGDCAVPIFYARDERWDASVPDLCATSRADLIRQAWECERAK